MAATMETSTQAKKKLLVLAKQVSNELLIRFGDRGHLNVFHPNDELELEESWGNGPSVAVAHLRKSQLEIALDYSDFWGGAGRRVWFGLYCPSRRAMHDDKVLNAVKRAVIKQSNDSRSNGEFRCFKQPLKNGEFGKTVEEDYSQKEVYLGVYSKSAISTSSLAKELVDWANGWLPSWVEAADKIEEKEWRSHRSVEYVYRNSDIARQAKLKAEFLCEVCKFKFDDKYGSLGTGYLEAHHLLPVAQQKDKEWATKLSSLSALCANCHKMLHALLRQAPVKTLKEGRAQFEELKKIVKKYEQLSATRN